MVGAAAPLHPGPTLAPWRRREHKDELHGMLRAVFFDAAGTLFHTREPAGLSYAKIARRFGVEADERLVIDSFKRSFGTAPGLAFGPGHEAAKLRRLEREWWRELVRATFANIGHFADFEAYFDALFAFFADPANWIRDPAAEPMLARLRENGLTLGVISNFDHRIYRILETLELSRYFDSITISSETGYAKPSSEIFRAALGRHSLSAADAIHVGDSESLDLAGARAAGLAAVLVDADASLPPTGQEPSLSGGRCVRVRSLGEVTAAIGQLAFH
jgi:putative hydrolase of the HAD superfamily